VSNSSGRRPGASADPALPAGFSWSTPQITEALEASGLRCLAALGQREEDRRVLLSDSPDEERDAKVVYIATHAA